MDTGIRWYNDCDTSNTLGTINSMFQTHINDLSIRFSRSPKDLFIIISISEQKLFLIKNTQLIETHHISSAKAGTGNLSGSYKTPLGVHQISEKFGKDIKLGTIFKSRISIHQIAKILTNPKEESNADNITSRILWLSGMEESINKGGNVDSHDRYIYIHGTDEEGRLGSPVSHGCIRMANQEIISLYNHVTIGTLVDIIV